MKSDHLPRLAAPLGPKALIPCVVSVTHGQAAPQRVRYEGLFRSTSDALFDALDRFPDVQCAGAKPKGKQR